VRQDQQVLQMKELQISKERQERQELKLWKKSQAK
jgi:hypothetical protein